MDTDKTEIIYGRQPTFEVLRGFRKIYTIYATTSALKWLKEKANTNNVEITADIRSVEKEKLYNLVRHPDHQGIAAKVEKYKYTSEKIILDRRPSLMLLADSITDPHNLGAIIRSANLFGVGAVIIPEKNSADINPVVVHSSAGATEHTPIVRVKSIIHFLHLLKERNYTIISAVKPNDDAISVIDYDINGNIALVMGSEGKGISKKIMNICDTKVYIPQYGEIDSFNVSVATGILLYQLRTKL